MPIANRSVEPVCVSQVKVPESVENEFDYIFNATLSNFIKQIACLTIKAKDIFDELTVSLNNVVDRSLILEDKIDRLTSEVKLNTSNVIQPLVSQQVEVYKSHNMQEDERFLRTEMPDCIRQMLDKAEPPPELYKFDEFRADDNESMKYYTDPDFFLREWLKNARVDKKKRKEKRKRKSMAPPRESLPAVPPPPPIINQVTQESTNEECVNYNYGDVSEYEDPRSYFQNESKTSVTAPQGNVPSQEFNQLPPPPPPPPLPPPPGLMVPPPPPPPIAQQPIIVYTNPAPQSKPIPEVNSIQNLLRDIQKGAVLKPVTKVKEEKRKTMDLRAMIAELRPAWDNVSESDESEED